MSSGALSLAEDNMDADTIGEVNYSLCPFWTFVITTICAQINDDEFDAMKTMCSVGDIRPPVLTDRQCEQMTHPRHLFKALRVKGCFSEKRRQLGVQLLRTIGRSVLAHQLKQWPVPVQDPPDIQTM